MAWGKKAFRFPNQLSGGEQQRVAIAVALANQPGMVLADEPTGELDTRTADEVLQALQDVCHTYGVTVVVVTHYAGTERFADRVVQIRDGRIVSESVSQRSFRRTGEVVKESFWWWIERAASSCRRNLWKSLAPMAAPACQ